MTPVTFRDATIRAAAMLVLSRKEAHPRRILATPVFQAYTHMGGRKEPSTSRSSDGGICTDTLVQPTLLRAPIPFHRPSQLMARFPQRPLASYRATFICCNRGHPIIAKRSLFAGRQGQGQIEHQLRAYRPILIRCTLYSGVSPPFPALAPTIVLLWYNHQRLPLDHLPHALAASESTTTSGNLFIRASKRRMCSHTHRAPRALLCISGARPWLSL